MKMIYPNSVALGKNIARFVHSVRHKNIDTCLITEDYDLCYLVSKALSVSICCKVFIHALFLLTN